MPDAGEGDGGEAEAGHADGGHADAGLADGGDEDAGEPDATVSDAGHEDAGEEDATVSDAGHEDAGTLEDAGSHDATLADAAHDAEAPVDAGHEDAVVDAGPATFTMIYTTILNDSATADCKSCHNGVLDRGGLDMGTTQEDAYLSLVNVEATGECFAQGRLRVAPGDAMASLFYNKVASKAPNGPAVVCGMSMPLDPPNPYVLTAAQLEMIASWINAGALDN
jgi:hypothetical protein